MWFHYTKSFCYVIFCQFDSFRYPLSQNMEVNNSTSDMNKNANIKLNSMCMYVCCIWKLTELDSRNLCPPITFKQHNRSDFLWRPVNLVHIYMHSNSVYLFIKIYLTVNIFCRNLVSFHDTWGASTCIWQLSNVCTCIRV